MSVRNSVQASDLPVFHMIVIGLWWMTIFVLALMADIDDGILFDIVILVYPAVRLALFLAAVPIWLLVRSALSLFRRRWRRASFLFAAVPIGLLLAFGGQIAGDASLVRIEGAALEQAVAATRSERIPTGLVMATSCAAYMATGVSFDMQRGVAYDSTGLLQAMFDLPTDERPREWLDRMPQPFSCWGAARPLGGNYYRTNIDRNSCSRW